MSAVARRGVVVPRFARGVLVPRVAESQALAPKTRYPPNDTDRLRLEDLLACGVTLARAAARLGISDDTARYHYRAVVEAAGISARARPAHEPSDRDRAIIRIMAAGGIRQADIAAVFGFSEKTLRAHYRRELDFGATLANARVAQSLFRAATSWLDEGPDAKPTSAAVAAAIFWTKARMGWRQASRTEPGRKADPPVDLRIVPADQLENFLAELAAEKG